MSLEQVATFKEDRYALLIQWAPVVMGLGVLYIPTYLDLATTVWNQEQGAHGPIVLAVVIWLLWKNRDALLDPADDVYPVTGWVFIIIGLISYILGRSQDFAILEVGSQIPLLLGVCLALLGKAAFRTLFFPIFFLAFLVPLPGSLLDVILLPLKQYVSMVVDHLLYLADYPISRNGVVLAIGPYQLLIANACSGLNSMIALSAVGVLFVYLVGRSHKLHNALLIASILPIAFVANIIRVMTLVLVTYHFGDSMGRTFHDFAGYLEIVFALGAFLALDRVLALVTERE